MQFEYLLIGGGLQNGLIALALLQRWPDCRLALIEREDRIGGNHIWSFHDTDVPDAAWPIIEPLIQRRWKSYEVRFPGLCRRLDLGYASILSERFDAVIRERFAAAPSAELHLSTEVRQLAGNEVLLADGSRYSAAVVLDGRGTESATPGTDRADRGFQKFVGAMLSLNQPHGLDGPVLMDATVPQTDGYRFFYLLPFSPTELFVEDTYFSDTSALDEAALLEGIERYARDRGWSIRAVDGIGRRESGVLGMPWRPAAVMPTPRFPSNQSVGPWNVGYRGGWLHPATGYSFPVALRLALWIAGQPRGEIRADQWGGFCRIHWRQLRFACLLNRLLFRAYTPSERWRVLARFYRLPEPSIARFYALQLRPIDKVRILCGRPPGGMRWFPRSRKTSKHGATPIQP